MLLNCGIGEDLRAPWTARRSNQPILKEISPGCSLNDWCWGWNSNILATWCEDWTHLKRLWCWERLRVGGKGDNRGWDGWMASPTWCTWVWVNSESWWWTARPSVQSGTTERLNWTERGTADQLLQNGFCVLLWTWGKQMHSQWGWEEEWDHVPACLTPLSFQLLPSFPRSCLSWASSELLQSER